MPENNVTTISCSFCGKSRRDVKKLIVTNDIGICDECISLCQGILTKEGIEQKVESSLSELLDPTKIKDYLDQHIIGQDNAKITVAVGVVNHFKRILLKPDVELEKSNILIYGPSGSGKTLLAKMIAKYLSIPFVIADATTLTEAGYVGDDVESLISRLLSEADNDVERCEKGIVFIDEIDKISRKSENPSVPRDVSGEGVQQALLKLVEGTKCRVGVSGSKKHPSLEQIEVDTSNILFIAGGAFSSIDDIVTRRQKNTGIGFGYAIKTDTVDRSQAEPEDFVKFGMIPEFTGRFPVVTYTDSLSSDDLVRILKEPKNNLIKQMQFYFKVDGVQLEFTEGAIKKIADHAVKLGTGARGLKAILEKILNPYMFSVKETVDQGIRKIEITEDLVKYTD